MIPLKIKPFFKTDYIKNDITSESVNCCETNAFNIYYCIWCSITASYHVTRTCGIRPSNLCHYR